MSLIDFMKSAAIVAAMTIIEWARAKQAHAEDKQAVAESDLAAEKAKSAIAKEYVNRSAHDVVREFLNRSKGK